MKKLTLLAAAILAVASPPALAGYQNTGDCADAVVNSCNAKYDGGKALNSCVNSGLRQCFKAFPSRPSQSTPASDPKLGPGKLAAPVTSSTLSCGRSSYVVSTGTAGGACSTHDYGKNGVVRICQDGPNGGMAWCAQSRQDACAAPAGHTGKGSCEKKASAITAALGKVTGSAPRGSKHRSDATGPRYRPHH